MADLSMRSTWTLELSSEELVLVLKALGGRLKPEERDAARLLGDDVTLNRIDQTREQMDRLEQNVMKTRA